jgi:hypothetical protein
LASKPVLTVFSGLASKLVARVSQFVPQKRQLRFDDLGIKITMIVSWFGPQNHIGYDLSVAPQNQREDDDVGHASRYSGLLHVEASQAKVSQSDLKIGGGVMTGGARGGGCVENMLKMDGSMRWAASDPATHALPFCLYSALVPL